MLRSCWTKKYFKQSSKCQRFVGANKTCSQMVPFFQFRCTSWQIHWFNSTDEFYRVLQTKRVNKFTFIPENWTSLLLQVKRENAVGNSLNLELWPGMKRAQGFTVLGRRRVRYTVIVPRGEREKRRVPRYRTARPSTYLIVAALPVSLALILGLFCYITIFCHFISTFGIKDEPKRLKQLIHCCSWQAFTNSPHMHIQ